MSVRVDENPDPKECDLCGACCKTFPIFVGLADAVREPAIVNEARRLAASVAAPGHDFQLFPLPFQTSCCFLEVDNACRIYATRPDVCRRFAAGNEQCQEARARLGLGPLLGNPATSDSPS